MIPTCLELNRPDSRILLCHDPYNRRVRVDELTGDQESGLRVILEHAPEWAEKIILKARREQVDFFLGQGWVQEAAIPGYFKGEDLFFLVLYPRAQRGHTDQGGRERSVVAQILEQEPRPLQPSGELMLRSTERDAEKLANLYRSVFEIYPTPLGDPAYILKTMESGTVYVHIEQDGRVLSAASAEVNRKFANAEMTDCATLSSQQGKGFMALLLGRLEEMLIPDKITCLYTICRAQSFGMNKVFYNLGYRYSGCLINNCNIYSGLENMNVWYKRIY